MNHLLVLDFGFPTSGSEVSTTTNVSVWLWCHTHHHFVLRRRSYRLAAADLTMTLQRLSPLNSNSILPKYVSRGERCVPFCLCRPNVALMIQLLRRFPICAEKKFPKCSVWYWYTMQNSAQDTVLTVFWGGVFCFVGSLQAESYKTQRSVWLTWPVEPVGIFGFFFGKNRNVGEKSV